VDETLDSQDPPKLKLPSNDDHHPLMLLALNSTSAVDWEELQTKVRDGFRYPWFGQFTSPCASGENSCGPSGKAPRQIQRTSCCTTTFTSHLCGNIPSTSLISSPCYFPVVFNHRGGRYGTQTIPLFCHLFHRPPGRNALTFIISYLF
jgi:hypothetical protein